MKQTILLTFLMLIFAACAVSANAQTVDCPPSLVCFDRADAIKINEKLDERTNLLEQVKDKTQAIEDLRGELNRLRVELGTYSGELIATKAELVRQNARVNFALENPPKKCKFSILCVITGK